MPTTDAGVHRRAPTAPEIAVASTLINACERPMVWVGGGAAASRAEQATDDLLWRLGAPAIATYAGRGVVPSGHPLLIDAPPHEPLAEQQLRAADLLIVLGSALDGMSTKNWTLPRPQRVIDVNVAPSGEWEPDVSVIADVRETLDALTVRLHPREPWADAPFAIKDTVLHSIGDDARTRSAAALIEAIDSSWPAAANIVIDMCVAGYWVGAYAATTQARRLAYPIGWGTLGFGLPAAIGAASGSQRTLAVVGDGGLAMAVGDLATVVEHALPITLLLVEDGGYGMLRYDFAKDGHQPRGVDLVGPDWLALASSFGLPAVHASTATLGGALASAASQPGPQLVLWQESLFPPRTTSPRWRDG